MRGSEDGGAGAEGISPRERGGIEKKNGNDGRAKED